MEGREHSLRASRGATGSQSGSRRRRSSVFPSLASALLDRCLNQDLVLAGLTLQLAVEES